MKKVMTTMGACLTAMFLFIGCRTATPAAQPVTAADQHIEEEQPDKELWGKRVVILVAEGFHDGETTEPMNFLKDLGAETTLVGIAPGELKAYNSDVMVTVEKAIHEVSPEDFDALVIPGGRSPAVLRQNEGVTAFVGTFAATNKPIAAICHGPQVLISAGIMDGRRSTGFSEIEGELTEAGALFEDSVLVRDGNIITSRIPDDLPEFNKAIKAALLEL